MGNQEVTAPASRTGDEGPGALETRGRSRGPGEGRATAVVLEKGNSSSFFSLRITRSLGLVLRVPGRPAGAQAKARADDADVPRGRSGVRLVAVPVAAGACRLAALPLALLPGL